MNKIDKIRVGNSKYGRIQFWDGNRSIIIIRGQQADVLNGGDVPGHIETKTLDLITPAKKPTPKPDPKQTEPENILDLTTILDESPAPKKARKKKN